MATCVKLVVLWAALRATGATPFGALHDVLDEGRLLQLYIPTMAAPASTCRNHSRLYAAALMEWRLWATEMFDASGKLPSGFLYGSTHDLGNFDECMAIRVPASAAPFRGQYCLAQFTVAPPADTSTDHASRYYETSDYQRYYNESMWAKLAVYAQDETKGSRNELYVAFCVPSSCTHHQLRSELARNVASLNNRSDFGVTVDVGARSCQMAAPQPYTAGDVALLCFLCASLMTVIVSSGYEIAVKRPAYRHLQLTDGWHQVAVAFSLPSNVRKLTAEGRNLDGLDCLAGMRAFSMVLIVALHRIMFEFGSPMLNPQYVEKLYTRFETTLLLNGPILVETFFTLSGFLAAYLMLGQLERSRGRLHLGAVYLHRLVRMTPTYALVLAFYCTLLVRLGSGPFWQQRVGLEQERCLASWWANLLYVNNYVNTDQICMFQSWYIACDMNFFLFTPLLAWLLWNRPRLGVALVALLILASMAVVFVVVYLNKLDAMFMLYIKVLKDPVAHHSFKALYIPGHMRGSSYLVGIGAGYLKHRMRSRKMADWVVRMGWALCAPIMVASLYTGFVFYLVQVPPVLAALYAALYHCAWSVCIAWMVLAVSAGHGPWVEPLLRWRPLVVLARLTYCVYISHGAIQLYTAATVRSPIYASAFHVEYQTAADVLLAYALALVLSVMYESPVLALEKAWRRPKAKAPPPMAMAQVA